MTLGSTVETCGHATFFAPRFWPVEFTQVKSAHVIVSAMLPNKSYNGNTHLSRAILSGIDVVLIKGEWSKTQEE